MYPSGNYSEEDIRIAKNSLIENVTDLDKKLYENRYKHLKDTRPEWEISVYSDWGDVYEYKLDMNKKSTRISQAFSSFGMSEIKLQQENAKFRTEAKKYVDKIKILRADMINEKYSEVAETANINAKEAANKVEYINKINKIKENQIYPLFIDLIQREREGKLSDVPNCVMISCGNEQVNKELVDWTSKNTNARFKSINYNQNLLEQLELAEKNFQETGDWNLIYIKDGDNLINPKKASFSCIESMKDIMSSTVDDYHSTLLFDSTKTEELDSIAMQPHRVRQISANIKSLDEMNIESAINRLTLKRAVDLPINTINDLITVFQLKVQKLKVAYRVEGLSTVEKEISKIQSQLKDANLEQIFKVALRKLKL